MLNAIIMYKFAEMTEQQKKVMYNFPLFLLL